MSSTLKVNTIQGASNTTTSFKTNGGTDALTIDTTGRVSRPVTPYIYMHGSSAAEVTSKGSAEVLSLIHI